MLSHFTLADIQVVAAVAAACTFPAVAGIVAAGAEEPGPSDTHCLPAAGVGMVVAAYVASIAAGAATVAFVGAAIFVVLPSAALSMSPVFPRRSVSSPCFLS